MPRTFGQHFSTTGQVFLCSLLNDSTCLFGSKHSIAHPLCNEMGPNIFAGAAVAQVRENAQYNREQVPYPYHLVENNNLSLSVVEFVQGHRCVVYILSIQRCMYLTLLYGVVRTETRNLDSISR